MNVTLTAASDRKPAACKFIQQHHGYQHIFTDAKDHIAASGVCFQHSRCGRKQVCTLTPEEKKVDFMVAGIPCHPFTRMRQRSDPAHCRKGSPSQHPDYGVVFSLFPEFLAERRPSGWLVEETDAFLEVDPQTGTRYVDNFIQTCSTLGYHCSAMLCKADVWLQWPRDRPQSNAYT